MLNRELRQLAENQAKVAAEGQGESRRAEAEARYLQGLSSLKAAHLSDFKDKRLLQDAFAAMGDALALDRQYPDPYVSMAYLYTILGDKPKARQYLKEALQLAPDHQEALELQQAMTAPIMETAPLPAEDAFLSPLAELDAETEEEQRQIALAELLDRIVNEPLYDFRDPQLQAFLKNATPREFDELYDYLESHVTQFVAQETQAEPPLSIEPLHVEEMAVKHAVSVGVYKVMDILLHTIDQEIDVTELKTRLKPVQILLRRMERNLNASRELAAIRQRIRASNQYARTVAEAANLITTPQEASRLEGLFERLLDECDHIADQLDHLDSQGTAIHLVESAYEQLANNIQGLQDQLDERFAAINETAA